MTKPTYTSPFKESFSQYIWTGECWIVKRHAFGSSEQCLSVFRLLVYKIETRRFRNENNLPVSWDVLKGSTLWQYRPHIKYVHTCFKNPKTRSLLMKTQEKALVFCIFKRNKVFHVLACCLRKMLLRFFSACALFGETLLPDRSTPSANVPPWHPPRPFPN